MGVEYRVEGSDRRIIGGFMWVGVGREQRTVEG